MNLSLIPLIPIKVSLVRRGNIEGMFFRCLKLKRVLCIYSSSFKEHVCYCFKGFPPYFPKEWIGIMHNEMLYGF